MSAIEIQICSSNDFHIWKAGARLNVAGRHTVHVTRIWNVHVALASFPGPRRRGEKGLVSTVCACGGIPPAPWTFDYLVTSKWIT